MSTLTAEAAFFEEVASNFARSYHSTVVLRQRLEFWHQYIARYARSGGMCIDAGCGPGLLLRKALELGMGGLGIDASPTMLRLARHNCQKFIERVRFEEVSLPWRDPELTESADLIICSSVLEYVPDVQAAARDFYRMLKPGGVLLASLPNRQSWFRKIESMRSFFVPLKYLRFQHHQFTLAGAQNLFADVNLVPEEIRCFSRSPLAIRMRLPESSPRAGNMLLCVMRKPG